MGYAITGGAGLLLGVGLLIWGLRERSARHKAERAADEAETARKESFTVATRNISKAMKAEEFAGRLDREVALLRRRLNEARVRLAQCGDPAAVKAWLDEELKAEEL